VQTFSYQTQKKKEKKESNEIAPCVGMQRQKNWNKIQAEGRQRGALVLFLIFLTA